ncbi:DUF3347 domain-containing protein [Niabella soli]|uniref:Mercury transporter n=1 Tax=Niabella soli DSM 19437 TaxID=929713 RepID=W0F6J3_9BACT|nr:DUF3347 domain-containing protein [Niabella soli]AHF16981.1 mercury transporter [Niabella soli DSM 19437]
MTTIKKYLLTVLIGLSAVSIVAATPIKNAATATVTIQGSSADCKKMIEAAGTEKQVSLLSWNPQTKQGQLTYNSKITSPEAILKRVALAGFDNEAYNAPVSVYNALSKKCQYKGAINARPQSESAPADPAHMEQDAAPSQTAPVAASRLEPLYKAYFAVGDALLASDARATAQKATELSNAVTAVKMEELEHKEHMAWMEVMNALTKEVTALKTASGIEKQRTAYAALSNAMYQLMKTSKSSYKIYYNECPMFNSGAHWLSKNETIRNPFYGAKMLSCGSTKAVIE